MPTHAYFEDIQSQIIKELQKAKQQILLAVAWFTDATLLEILCQKAQKGVKVSLLLQDDQINRGNYAPNFDNLQKSGGEILWVKP
ncbi:MAG: hypothetical protein EAZ97_05810 [Bacteroidetes bacterium]|nr:MAG: hypothetical protein EAZ97_05810 [Bacteroidota bacterium]